MELVKISCEAIGLEMIMTKTQFENAIFFKAELQQGYKVGPKWYIWENGDLVESPLQFDFLGGARHSWSFNPKTLQCQFEDKQKWFAKIETLNI